MVDDVNKLLVLLAILGIVGAFAVGAYLTNLGNAPGQPAAGGVDPTDWSAAANAICSDTNAEVVDLDISTGPEADPVDVLRRGEQILARRADGLEALPTPSDRSARVDALVAEMRTIQTAMQRVVGAMERGDLDQAERLAPGLDGEALARLSYELDAPWCDVFGADDPTIKAMAAANVLELQGLLELYHADVGTYVGAGIETLRERYGTELVEGEASVVRADAASYCAQSTVGNLTLHVEGRDGSDLVPGSC